MQTVAFSKKKWQLGQLCFVEANFQPEKGKGNLLAIDVLTESSIAFSKSPDAAGSVAWVTIGETL